MTNHDESSLTNSTIEATGSAGESRKVRVVPYPFDRYVVYVKLDERNQFVGIAEIRINKQFLSSKQQLDSMTFLDVEEFYKEE